MFLQRLAWLQDCEENGSNVIAKSFWFRRYCHLQKWPNFPFRPWTIVHGHQKIQSIGISSKKSYKYNLMSNACTPILVGVAILVSEILLPSKTTKFSFLTIDWSSKNSINRNWLKKFMLVGINVTCMHTNFGGCTFSSFGDITTFKNGQNSLSDLDYSPWSSKNSIDRNWLKKYASRN